MVARRARVHGPVFPDLTSAKRSAGQTYATNLPSMFIVGHVDYVRTVRLVRHKAGMLMPEEYELHRFHNWVRERHTTLSPKF
ncbi:hypothetical protein [Mesorhizobium sp. f-mel]